MNRPALLTALAALALSAGCRKPAPPAIEFETHAPYYSKMPDNRTVKAYCPHCGNHIPWSTAKCPIPIPPKNKPCNGEIKWEQSVRCEYCRGTGACTVCAAHKMLEDGSKCFHCKGRGFTDLNLPCPNCEGSKLCPACKGKGKCDFCEVGKYSIEGKKGVKDPEDSHTGGEEG